MQQRVPQDNLWAELVSAGYGIKAGIHGIHGIRTVSGTVSIASCVVSMVSGGKKNRYSIYLILFFFSSGYHGYHTNSSGYQPGYRPDTTDTKPRYLLERLEICVGWDAFIDRIRHRKWHLVQGDIEDGRTSA